MREDRATIHLGVSGATGRLGGLVMRLAREDDRLEAVPLPREGGDATSSRLDVIVDMSSDEGCRRALEAAGAHGVPIVVGTTGLSPETVAKAHHLAKTVAVAIVPNLSRGALLMRRLASLAARLAPTDWSFDLVETHRAGKRDAPSGTAVAIGAESVGPDGSGRLDGRIASVRTGDVVGEHRLRIVAAGEELVIEHRALERMVFARGAIDAAVWIVDLPPGLHRFESSLESRGDRRQGVGGSEA